MYGRVHGLMMEESSVFLLFLGSVFLVFHAYFGYPVSLFLIRRIHRKVVSKGDDFHTGSKLVPDNYFGVRRGKLEEFVQKTWRPVSGQGGAQGRAIP